MLSTGYTLHYSDALRVCHAAGLDLLIGFWHQPSDGRASLACDLVELMRHQVDAWPWDLVRHQLRRRDHFINETKGDCLRKHVYEHYMLQAPQWLKRLRQLTGRLGRHIDSRGE